MKEEDEKEGVYYDFHPDRDGPPTRRLVKKFKIIHEDGARSTELDNTDSFTRKEELPAIPLSLPAIPLDIYDLYTGPTFPIKEKVVDIIKPIVSKCLAISKKRSRSKMTVSVDINEALRPPKYRIVSRIIPCPNQGESLLARLFKIRPKDTTSTSSDFSKKMLS